MRNFLMIVALSASTAAFAGDVEQAAKKIGPAFLCSPPYEYNRALDDYREALVKSGMPEALAADSVGSIDRFVNREHAGKRRTITAEECATKYGRAS